MKPGLNLCVGIDVPGFVAALDVDTARLGLYEGSVLCIVEARLEFVCWCGCACICGGT